jgi:uncharacterized protein (DUF362 family)
MNQMFKPLMNIIDALTAVVNGGPQGDGADTVRTTPGLIFASRDRVAVDPAAVSLIQLELDSAMVPMPDASNATLKRDPVWKLPQIVNGIERGIGMGDPTKIELAFDGVMRPRSKQNSGAPEVLPSNWRPRSRSLSPHSRA